MRHDHPNSFVPLFAHAASIALFAFIPGGLLLAAENVPGWVTVILLRGNQRQAVSWPDTIDTKQVAPLPPVLSALQRGATASALDTDRKAAQEVDVRATPATLPVSPGWAPSWSPTWAVAMPATEPPVPQVSRPWADLSSAGVLPTIADNSSARTPRRGNLTPGAEGGVATLNQRMQQDRPQNPSWFESQLLQAAALSVGLSIALSMSAIGILVIAIRQLAKKGDSTIRGEHAFPTAAYDMLRATPAPTSSSVNDRCEDHIHRTSVTDLTNGPLPIPALGPTFEERRKKKDDLRKWQEQEILLQIFEDNLNFLEASTALREQAVG